MPTSVVALVTLVLFALPGYVFQQRLRRRSPELSRSAFEEILVILFSGVAVDAIVVLLFVAAGQWFRLPLPRADQAILGTRDYLARHFAAAALWSGAFLAVAVGVALLVTSPVWRVLTRRWLDAPLGRRARGSPNQSAWWLLFHENPGTRIHVGCVLTDGSYVAGYLHSYSRQTAETRDRELTLRGDIVYRPPGQTDPAVLPKVNAASVSADRIQLLTVTYVDDVVAEEPDGADA